MRLSMSVVDVWKNAQTDGGQWTRRSRASPGAGGWRVMGPCTRATAGSGERESGEGGGGQRGRQGAVHRSPVARCTRAACVHIGPSQS
eukprot:352743-Chlamydomonas_euryale.AAC.16